MTVEEIKSSQNLSQAEKIIRLLRIRKSKGVTNIELNNGVCFRYGARIHELRKDGYDIRTKHIKGSKWLFWLEPSEEEKQRKLDKKVEKFENKVMSFEDTLK